MPAINVHRYVSPTYSFQDYFIATSSYNANNAPVVIEIDTGFLYSPGEYAIIRSVLPLQNYTIAATINLTPANGPYYISSVTGPGIGDVREINGTNYYCICAVILAY